jgi:hypothetical protein
LPTKAHFSSNATAWVSGGKAHQLVVQLLGVVAGAAGVADDGVLGDACEAARLSDAAALAEVLEDADDAVIGESGVEQGGALAFGETGLAGAADEQAALLVLAVAEADTEVAFAALAVVSAVRIEAAEAVEVVVHGAGS